MDFEFTEEEIKFREEVREFMAKELPSDWQGIPWAGEPERETKESLEFARNFTKKMREKGWLTMHWPRKYGGEDASIAKQLILAEEVGYWNAPVMDIYGPSIVGLTLINFGTEEQRKEHLPLIREGNVIWTQGYSEPDAGSDLASLRTAAIEDGDYFVINGQKTWSSIAHYADMMFVLARTDPNTKNHQGISLFYCDMKTPGITFSPIINIAGGHTFNDVFFDDVRIPKKNLIGEKNRGFYIAMASLDYERSGGVSRAAEIRRQVEELVDFINDKKQKGEAIPNENIIRHRLAQLAVDTEVSRLLAYRVLHVQKKGKPVTHEASMQFAFLNDLAKRMRNVSLQVLGLYGQLGMQSRFAPLGGRVQRSYLYTPAIGLAGGSTEINRNVIAWRGLGLPRL